MTFRARFVLAACAWTLLTAGLVVALPLAVAHRLPDPVASHWGTSGRPDDSMSLTAVLVIALVLFAVLTTPCLGAAIHGVGLRRRPVRACVVAGLAWAGTFVPGVMALTVWANLDVTTWRAARPLTWQPFALFAATFGVGALAYLLGRRGPDEPVRPSDSRRRVLTPKPGERVTWVSAATNGILLGLGWAFLTVGVVLALVIVVLRPSPWLWLAAGSFALTGIAGLAISTIRVQVTEAGLGIAFGPLRWPVRRVGLTELDDAWAERRMPHEVGGWGYRGLPGSATIMIRGGDCLVIRYRDGGTLGISVDDAERGAGLINGLLAARTRTS